MNLLLFLQADFIQSFRLKHHTRCDFWTNHLLFYIFVLDKKVVLIVSFRFSFA